MNEEIVIISNKSLAATGDYEAITDIYKTER